MSAALLAFEVTIGGDSDFYSITFAHSVAAARWNAVRSYRDAGFGRPGQWPNVKAKRIQCLDGSVLRHQGRRCWVPEYARSCAVEFIELAPKKPLAGAPRD